MVCLIKDRDLVGLSASRSPGFSKLTILIGCTGFDTTSSIRDPTLSLSGEFEKWLALVDGISEYLLDRQGFIYQHTLTDLDWDVGRGLHSSNFQLN